MCSCSLFFSLPLIFTLVAASISPVSHRRYKFLCFSSNEIGLLWFLTLAGVREMQNFIPAYMKGWTYVRN